MKLEINLVNGLLSNHAFTLLLLNHCMQVSDTFFISKLSLLKNKTKKCDQTKNGLINNEVHGAIIHKRLGRFHLKRIRNSARVRLSAFTKRYKKIFSSRFFVKKQRGSTFNDRQNECPKHGIIFSDIQVAKFE